MMECRREGVMNDVVMQCGRSNDRSWRKCVTRDAVLRNGVGTVEGLMMEFGG